MTDITSQQASTPGSLSKPQGQREFFIPDLCNVQAVLFLVLVAELLAIVLELAASGLMQFSWQSLAMKSLFVQWCFLLSAALLCQVRQALSNWPLAWAALLCYLLILLVAASTSLLGQTLLSYIEGKALWRFDLWLLATHVTICAVLAGIALRYFYLTQQLRVRQKTELQARIQALQSRIRPHFLFNSMNIIASLIAVDQEAAETAVEDLAALFRASLSEVEAEVSLSEELALCRRYTHIEQLRLGERLKLNWEIDTLPLQLKIPGLTLQPLLENAIYHGIQQLPDGGTVTVRGSYDGAMLSLEVINPVPDTSRNSSSHTAGFSGKGNKLALNNIQNRLQVIYGPKADLITQLSENDYCAKIRYPVTLEEA